MGNVPYRTQLDKWVSLPRAVASLFATFFIHRGRSSNGDIVHVLSPQPLAWNVCLFYCLDIGTHTFGLRVSWFLVQGRDYLGGDAAHPGAHAFDFPCNVSESGNVSCPN